MFFVLLSHLQLSWFATPVDMFIFEMTNAFTLYPLQNVKGPMLTICFLLTKKKTINFNLSEKARKRDYQCDRQSVKQIIITLKGYQHALHVKRTFCLGFIQFLCVFFTKKKRKTKRERNTDVPSNKFIFYISWAFYA